VPLGPRAVGWLEAEVSEWIAERVRIARGGSRHDEAHARLPAELNLAGSRAPQRSLPAPGSLTGLGRALTAGARPKDAVARRHGAARGIAASATPRGRR
ncbi:MAG: AlpA family phage regulatory protein, partial [Burkholderiales bacterium]|nr:AlpA family phage regulatory protein [Burkholderiales bacterium]